MKIFKRSFCIKNKWLAIVLIALIGIVAMIGCDNGSSGSDNTPGSTDDTDTADPGVTPSYVVYLAGFYDDSGVSNACYWKNGIKTDLDVGEAYVIAVVEK